MEQTAALRLNAEWVRAGAGRGRVPARERLRRLTALISALTPHADTESAVAATLGRRYADLARHHYDGGRRDEALAAWHEAVRRCAGPARHDPEHARWYADALTSQAVCLAQPLRDELGLPRYPYQPVGDRPSPADRADGLAALAATRRAIEVWEGLDPGDQRNREGLAQAHAFLGDRLEELGDPVEATAWAARAERGLTALRPPGGVREQRQTAVLEHLAEQLERRLRRCPFHGGLTRLRAEDLLPERLLPLAVLAARIEGVAHRTIAAGLGLAEPEVRRMLRARSWRAVWRFDTRSDEGAPWTPVPYPWRGTDAMTDLGAAEVAEELADAFADFLASPGAPGGPVRPPEPVQWRLAVWWEDEEHPDGARVRRTGPAGLRSGTAAGAAGAAETRSAAGPE
jgi:hypothetical protein